MENNNSPWVLKNKTALTLNNDVHLWLIQYDICLGQLENLFTLLTSAEKKRAQKFHFETDYQRFVITRGFLRKILAELLNNQPHNIIFKFNEYGKPQLEKNELYFNVSHSGNLGLIAITRLAPIGVDVEKFRKEMTPEKIARRFFSETEVTDYLNLNDSQKLQGFFNCWSRKEAFIKAVGKGLSLSLKSFDVSLIPGKPAEIKSIREPQQDEKMWTLKDINVGNDYSAAFTLKATEFKTNFWLAC